MSASIIPADSTGIARAARELRAGRLVGFPTETVYGLGADADNAEAVRAVFAAKGRPGDHPLIVHLADARQISEWAREFPPGARVLAERFMPGALTLILPRAGRVIDAVTGGQDSVGLRVPSHPVAHALLAAFQGGVAAPSANRFGKVSPTTAAHVAGELGESVALILDGGPCEVGIESTVVDFTAEPGRAVLLRPGGVALRLLTGALGYEPMLQHRLAPRASGTLASHYAPETPARLVAGRELIRAVQAERDAGRKVGILTLSGPPERIDGVLQYKGGRTALRYARTMYRNLRALDFARLDVILIEAPPRGADWMAVNDRLVRATHRS